MANVLEIWIMIQSDLDEYHHWVPVAKAWQQHV